MRSFPSPLRSLFVVALLTSASVACGSPSDTDLRTEDHSSMSELVGQTGTVQWFDLEGGFFAIRGDDGVVYDPTNLAGEFRRDGLRVRFDAEIKPNMGGIHMVGPIVEIVAIERLTE